MLALFRWFLPGVTPQGTSRVIAIGEEAPKSPTDLFILNLARSRADAVVTTGNLLRTEPRLTHLIEGPTETQEQLGAWRQKIPTPQRITAQPSSDERSGAGFQSSPFPDEKPVRHLYDRRFRRAITGTGPAARN